MFHVKHFLIDKVYTKLYTKLYINIMDNIIEVNQKYVR